MSLGNKFRIIKHPAGVLLSMLLLVQILSGCDYARMKEDEALRTFETSLPEMPKGSIPVSGGVTMLREANPKDLQNPIIVSQAVLDRGKQRYVFYCIQCHGPKANGFGTVGQSFKPLPTDLRDPHVQEQSDGDLFHKIAFGYKRHPALLYTVGESDTWVLVHYLRYLAGQPNS
jgi:hypothetical protein